MPTAQEVKDYREMHGVGMQDAKRILTRQEQLERIELLRGRNAGFGPASRSVVDEVLVLLRELTE